MKAASLLLLALAGCAHQPEFIWVKPGGTTQDFSIDSGQCRAQAFSVPGVSLPQAVIVMEACLQGKGWTQQAVR
jgi:hypothetical protein